MLKIVFPLVIAAAVLAFVGLPASPAADDGCCGGTSEISADAPATRPAETYPLEVCPVTGEKLGSMGEPVVKEIDGRTVKFCCAGCVSAFEQEPEKWHKKMDEMIVEAGKADYPLENCVVSGEKLGSKGEPINLVHRPTNSLVRFCCNGCTGAFKKNPEKFLEELAKAEAAAQEAEDAPSDQ